MRLEVVSDKQGISTMIMFLLGTNFIIGTAGAAKKDAWLAILIGMAAAQVILLVYSRILSLYPNKDVLDINELVFGKYLGKIINIFYTVFAVYLSSQVLYISSQFITIIGLTETPAIVPVIFLTVLCIWSAKEGIELIGRCSDFFILAVFASFTITTLLTIPKMELDNLRPVLYEGVTPLLKGAVTAFFFPFTETMIFLMVFNSFSSKKSPYKIYSISSIIAGLIIAAVSARNIMAAGIEVTSKYYFPSFIVVSRINIGDFLQRIELIVMVVIILSVYVKISCCLLAASKCVSKILGFKDYRFIISPVALLIIGISFKLFENMQEAIGWVQLYMPINNFIFTICVVLFTYLRSEFYHRKNFSKQRN